MGPINGNLKKWLLGILATWVTIGVPATIGLWSSATAEEAAKEAIREHAARGPHKEVVDLKTVQGIHTEKLKSLKEDTADIKVVVNELLRIQLERRN